MTSQRITRRHCALLENGVSIVRHAAIAADDPTMNSDHNDAGTQQLLGKRQQITEALLRQPYDLVLYLERSSVHSELGYPDLSAGDSYRALLLCDECINPGFEYHDQALEALSEHAADGLPSILHKRHESYTHPNHPSSGGGGAVGTSRDAGVNGNHDTAHIVRAASIRCYQNLAISLLLCGCLKSAFEFCARGLASDPNDEELFQAKEYIEKIAKGRLKTDHVEAKDLPDDGLVRREIYPWNDHEPNRFSQESLDFLNAELRHSSTNAECKITELPTLLEAASHTDEYENIPTNKQLGLFATADIPPGQTVLDEVSLLAANIGMRDSLCDACSSALPQPAANSGAVSCPDCEEAMFCSEDCLRQAQQAYHPAVCDKNIDVISETSDPKEKPNVLYLLLLARSVAMAATQDIHPLDLKELKYIWGDFLSSYSNAVSLSPNAPPPPIWTLPFSFQYNIAGPLHILEKMEIDVFASLAQYDLWVLNTLYSKFRGTASGRVSVHNGHPEVAAVHPLWCLANHDCDPNVQWEWGGRMRLWCRENRIGGRAGGIRQGEEIRNHYCDIDLKVQDRREWAKGALGGWCMCDRCRTEAAEEESVRVSNGAHVQY